MILFTLTAVPLFTLLIAALYQLGSRGAAAGFNLPAAFFKGLLFCLPALFVMLLVNRIIPLSYRPLRHYLFYTLQDHLLPYLLLLILCAGLARQGSTLQLVFISGGFYTLIALSEVIFHRGWWDIYGLFLLPVIRMSSLLYLVLLLVRYREWYGAYKVLFAVLILLVPLFGGLLAYLNMRYYPEAAYVGTGLFFCGALIFFLLGKEH